jgi:uncharacterized protein
VKHPLKRLHKRWEGLCLRCGKCCYEKTIEDGVLEVHDDRPCPCLDTKTMECRVYEKRFSYIPECSRMTLLKAIFASWLPESCGYVQWAKRIHLRP